MACDYLQVLNLAKQGKWHQAHQMVQPHSDTLACLLHGYLHRIEGDSANAAYWYPGPTRRCRTTVWTRSSRVFPHCCKQTAASNEPPACRVYNRLTGPAMRHYLKYLSSFFFPVCVVWFLAAGPHAAGAAIAWTLPLWLLLAVDWFSPKIDPEQRGQVLADGYYDAILYFLAFLHFLIIGLLLVTASQLHWQSMHAAATSIVNLIVMRILVGTTSGSSAIIVAHELIHRRQRHLRVLGRLLLYTVCYEHFVLPICRVIIAASRHRQTSPRRVLTKVSMPIGAESASNSSNMPGIPNCSAWD